MNRSIFEVQADFCKAMGNATRLQILHTLRKGPMIVGDIVRETGLSQSLVSRQLGVLRNVGVLEYQRHGNEMIYQLTDERIGEVCDLVRKVLVVQIQNRSRI
ncbi:MAG TPA: transcriptional regulator [Cytophagales bacterium]|jgi:ArsR family transcriptional regulator, cadmium/lead-responsive transcriptional repressor|nr:transcriptional regulator [Cytophagales bacterium]